MSSSPSQFDPSDPDKSKQSNLILWIKPTADPKSFKDDAMKKLFKELRINRTKRKKYETGYFYFAGIVEKRVEIDEEDDDDIKDEDDDDDEDKEDDQKENKKKKNQEKLWKQVEKLYIDQVKSVKLVDYKRKCERYDEGKRKTKPQKPIFFKYIFKEIISLAKPVKFSGTKGQGQGSFSMNENDINKCLMDKNINTKDMLNIAQRHIGISVGKSICVGFDNKTKMEEIREGLRPLLDINKEVKYKYINFNFVCYGMVQG